MSRKFIALSSAIAIITSLSIFGNAQGQSTGLGIPGSSVTPPPAREAPARGDRIDVPEVNDQFLPPSGELAGKGPGGTDDDNINEKVIGGRTVSGYAYPFMVALIKAETALGNEANGMFCAGTLVTNEFVMTAAHCLNSGAGADMKRRAARDINVYVAGDGFRSGDRIGVRSVHVHENFNPITKSNDIALIFLDRIPEERNAISKVYLPKQVGQDQEMKGGQLFDLLGWGATEKNGDTNEKLQIVAIKSIDKAACTQKLLNLRMKRVEILFQEAQKVLGFTQEAYNYIVEYSKKEAKVIVSNDVICAATSSSGDACQGDSGGPLFVSSFKDQHVIATTQYGIVSWGSGCGEADGVGVYTRVGRYFDWIKATHSAAVRAK